MGLHTINAKPNAKMDSYGYLLTMQTKGLPRSLLQFWIIYQFYFSSNVLCLESLQTSNSTSASTTDSSPQPSTPQPLQPTPPTVFTTANPPDLLESSGQSDPDLIPVGPSEDGSTIIITSQPITERTPKVIPGTIQTPGTSEGSFIGPDLGSGEFDRGSLVAPENETQLAPAGVNETYGPHPNDTLTSASTIPATDNLSTDLLIAPISTTPEPLLLTDPSQNYVTANRTFQTTSVSVPTEEPTTDSADLIAGVSVTLTTLNASIPAHVPTLESILTPEANVSLNVTSDSTIRSTSPEPVLVDTKDTLTDAISFSNVATTAVSPMNITEHTETTPLYNTSQLATMSSHTTTSEYDASDITSETTTNLTLTTLLRPIGHTVTLSNVSTVDYTETDTFINRTTAQKEGTTSSLLTATAGSSIYNDTSTYPVHNVTSPYVTPGVTDDENVTATIGTPPGSGPGLELWIIIVAAIAGFFLVLIIIFIACCIKRKRGDKARKMRYVGDDDNIMDYAYHPRRPASSLKQNGTTSRESAGMRTSPPRPTSEENPTIHTMEDGIEFDPTTKPAFRNYFQANLDSSNETLESNEEVNRNNLEPEFSHNSVVRRDKNKAFPLQPLDPKKARMSMGPIMLSDMDDVDAEDSRPSTQKTYDKMYTHSTFRK